MTSLIDLQNALTLAIVTDSSVIAHGELTLCVKPEHIKAACFTLRDDFAFSQCVDVCGVDYLTYGVSEWVTTKATGSGFDRAVHALPPSPEDSIYHASRFAVVYHLLSLTTNQRVRLKVFLTAETDLRVDSVVDIWPAVNWFEREAFDLYGILFNGHPDLRRILTDYGFIGHPFRKDFPLSGQLEVRYDATRARVVYEPVSITPRVLVPKVIRGNAPDNV